MRWWIRTMDLMARARVLSPELDSLSLWFFLSSLGGVSDNDPFFHHTFLGVGFDSTSFLFRFQKFLTLDPSSRISVVVKLNLLRLLLNP